jgi:hypothetical protein
MNQTENLASSLLYRSWYRNPTFFRKFYAKSLEWSIKNSGVGGESKMDFFFNTRIASIQSKSIYNPES